VVGGGPDERQAQADVDAGLKGQQLEGNEPLIMVKGDHKQVLPAQGAPEGALDLGPKAGSDRVGPDLAAGTYYAYTGGSVLARLPSALVNCATSRAVTGVWSRL